MMKPSKGGRKIAKSLESAAAPVPRFLIAFCVFEGLVDLVSARLGEKNVVGCDGRRETDLKRYLTLGTRTTKPG